MKPPEARVVRDDLKFLAPAPRRVPVSLWLRIMFGGWGNSTVYFIFALLTWIVVGVHLATGGKTASDEPPVTYILAAFIAFALPVIIGFAIYNSRRLRLLRTGELHLEDVVLAVLVVAQDLVAGRRRSHARAATGTHVGHELAERLRSQVLHDAHHVAVEHRLAVGLDCFFNVRIRHLPLLC